MNRIQSAVTSEAEQVGEAANEFFAAISRGEEPSISEFTERYPEIADHIHRTFPALLLVGSCSKDSQLNGEQPVHGNLLASNERKTLGDFRLVCEIGRGGMGTVFEAEQLSMGRRVALKVLPFAALVHENSLQRFRNEVRAAAALNHPNIVPVYSIGEERGVHFYAMQLIRGRTLADLIDELRRRARGNELVDLADSTHPTAESMPAPSAQARISTAVDSRRDAESYRAAARLGIQAAEALQHAHDQGVLHRDIKPSNLLLDAEGKLYVTDFGLARIEADAGMTMTGDIVGTLRYMAPEQALAKRVVIDHRADIYSLGATLYELLTLQPTFGENDRSELLKRIAFEEPRPLRKIDRRIPFELETIVLKSIAKRPDGRYQSAQQLADDLRAYLEDRPIKAKPPTMVERAARWSRRHVAVVWSAAAILLVSTIVLIVAGLQIAKWYRETEHQRKFTETQLKEAQTQEKSATAVADFLQQMLTAANPGQNTNGVSYTVRQLLDTFSSELSDRLADQPLVEAKLRIVVADAYRHLGLFDQAEPHYQAAVVLPRSASGPNDLSVASAMASHAWNLRESGRLDEAIASVREALDIYRLDGSPRLLNVLPTLHRFLVWKRNYRDADTIAAEILTLAGDLDTIESREVAGFLHGQAGQKLAQGDYLAAEAIARQAVVLHRRLRGNRHPQTGFGLSTLGRALQAQQKLAEAENAQREALGIFREHYSSDHYYVQLITSRLANVLKAKNATEELSKLEKDNVDSLEKAIRVGASDPRSFNYLAWWLATSNIAEIRDGKRAVELATNACVRTSYKNPLYVDTLAAAHAENGNFAEAMEWSQKSITAVQDGSVRAGFARHLESFKDGKPWRGTME